jgi:hypothetical protein
MHRCKKFVNVIVALTMAVGFPGIAAANLVTNGGFELDAGANPSQVGQVNVFTTLQGWTVGAPQNSGQPHAFVFVLDQNADSIGFPSENSPPNIKVWGPGNGVNNGFTGSPDGGHFLGGDADYARGTVSQSVSGLTVGTQYTLAFDWAGSQFTDQTGQTTQWWNVNFGGNSVDTAHVTVPSQGFTGWMHATMNFTATNASEVLSFLASASPFANGGPAGLPPFVLLDGVSLNPTNATPTPTPEPSSLLLLGIGAVGLCVARLRRRRAAAVPA